MVIPDYISAWADKNGYKIRLKKSTSGENRVILLCTKKGWSFRRVIDKVALEKPLCKVLMKYIDKKFKEGSK